MGGMEVQDSCHIQQEVKLVNKAAGRFNPDPAFQSFVYISLLLNNSELLNCKELAGPLDRNVVIPIYRLKTL